MTAQIAPDRDAKELANACAQAALAGIVATPQRDDRGRRTIVLTRGAWTREVRLHEVAEALAEAKARGGAA